jgi:branched-chain amino acid transport system ATP-binding protein
VTEVLAVDGLCKAFGGIVVADGIDLVLRKGRVLGLIGPNGAGKTSLFNLVCGVVQPDAGRIALNGESIEALPVRERARRGLARTWQNLRLFPSLTVLDNLMLGPREYSADRLSDLLLRPGRVASYERAAREKAWAILERTGLKDIANRPIQDISFGQQKLVGVARALMNDARCLLLDEPMAGVEGQAYALMQKAVRDIAETGVAICVVEHNVAFIRDLCDEGVFMFAGKALARGTVEALIADPQLTELYFGS